MGILLMVFCILLLLAIVSGFRSTNMWQFTIGLNTFAYPSFEFGVSSRFEIWEGNEQPMDVQIVTIGLVVFVMEFHFFS